MHAQAVTKFILHNVLGKCTLGWAEKGFSSKSPCPGCAKVAKWDTLGKNFFYKREIFEK